MDLRSIRGWFERATGSLGAPTRVIAVLAGCILSGILVFWLFNQVFSYFLARSYVDELADAYNLNRGFATALLWTSFAAIVGCFGLVFSFARRKRYAGYAGLLALLVGHSIALGMVDRNFKGALAEKCYVLTRDSVKILNRVGFDPETGRECRALTPVMAEKIELYRTGKRPTRITAGVPSFFSEISGEPVVWYAKPKVEFIELFDLMGYHPQTGEELRPVSRDVVEAWRVQISKVISRPAKRVDPNDFFDKVTGEAKVWFWRADGGQYEFYDGPGFQPRTGDALQIITRADIAEWRKSLAEAAATQKAEQERLVREAAEQADRERRDRQERADSLQRARQAEDKAKEIEAAEVARKKQFGDDCDRLATNPSDPRRAAPGVPFDQLKIVAGQALEACGRAVEMFPGEQRYLYQLGRAAQFRDKKRAFEIFTSLVAERYPAAFDNLGGMLLERKDIAGAIALFTQGAGLNDADSMVSLADLVDKGYYGQQNPYQVKWNLLNKAAQLDHAGSLRAVSLEKSRVDAAEIDRENQKEAARRAGEIIGAILGGIR